MTVFVLLLAGLALWGIVGTLIVTARDGYHRRAPDAGPR
jgi:hypothetical protein